MKLANKKILNFSLSTLALASCQPKKYINKVDEVIAFLKKKEVMRQQIEDLQIFSMK